MDRKITGTFQIVVLHNCLFDEDSIEIRFFNEDMKNRIFEGPLFWDPDEDDEVTDIIIVRRMENVDIEDFLIEAYKAMKFYRGVAKDDQTLKTMMHWQYINGFSDYSLKTYAYLTDSDYLAEKGVPA